MTLQYRRRALSLSNKRIIMIERSLRELKPASEQGARKKELTPRL